MKDDFKRASNKDCGGRWKCYCCGPKPSERPKFRRIARHRLKQWDRESQ